MRCSNVLARSSVAAVAAVIAACSAGCYSGGTNIPKATMVDAAAAVVSRDTLGVANASDVEIEVWLATEGSVLESASPRWFVDGPWSLPPGSLWVHGQQAHERTLAAARPGVPPPDQAGQGRAFVCVRYAGQDDAPLAWAEVTRGGLGVRRPMTSTDLRFLHMPRDMDEPLREVYPERALTGVPRADLPSRPRQAAELHENFARVSLPIRTPTIVLNPRTAAQAPVAAGSAPAPKPASGTRASAD